MKKESVSRVLQKRDEWHEQKDAAPCAFEVAVVTRARGSSPLSSGTCLHCMGERLLLMLEMTHESSWKRPR